MNRTLAIAVAGLVAGLFGLVEVQVQSLRGQSPPSPTTTAATSKRAEMPPRTLHDPLASCSSVCAMLPKIGCKYGADRLCVQVLQDIDHTRRLDRGGVFTCDGALSATTRDEAKALGAPCDP